MPVPGKDLLTGLIEVGKPTLSGGGSFSWDGQEEKGDIQLSSSSSEPAFTAPCLDCDVM